jgi:hypothetical protein
MSRVYSGLWSVRVVFEWNGELVHDFTEAVPYDDAARDCFAFGLGIPYWHGMTPVRVLRARIVAVEEAA